MLFLEGGCPNTAATRSVATPSLMAQMMYQKYAMGLPLARLERDWYWLGLVLPRNDMDNSSNQKKYLENFMEDGRLPLTNNLCPVWEPYPTVRDRETGLALADTPKGAKASEVLYTLVESAKANDLDVYGYLKYLLTEMPNNRHPEHPEVIDRYLPWSAELPEECRLKHRSTKCLKR